MVIANCNLGLNINAKLYDGKVVAIVVMLCMYLHLQQVESVECKFRLDTL